MNLAFGVYGICFVLSKTFFFYRLAVLRFDISVFFKFILIFFCFLILVVLRVPSKEHSAWVKIPGVKVRVNYYAAVSARMRKVLGILKKNEDKLKKEQAVYQLICDDRLGRVNSLGKKFRMFEDAHAEGRRELLRLGRVISRTESMLRKVEPKSEELNKQLAYLERVVRRGYDSYKTK